MNNITMVIIVCDIVFDKNEWMMGYVYMCIYGM